MIILILRITRKFIPKRISDEVQEEIQGAIGGTLFLGGCAVIGIVLRGKNAVSDFAIENKPDGVSVGFIDPTFAVVCIVLVWAYAAYRIVRLCMG